MAKPIHYHIAIEPDLDSFSFRASVDIDIEKEKSEESIRLDAHADLLILSCFLVEGDVRVSTLHKRNKSQNRLTIDVPQRENKLKIAIEFSGILNESLAGFYRSGYMHENKKRYIATTQFEAAEAKRAFPCFDEPAMKATFDVSFVIDKKLQAVSNTLPKSEYAVSNTKKRIDFERTPKMSTYLLYFGIGNWEMIEKKFGSLLIRGIATPGKSEQTRFAIDWAARCLAFYETYFGKKYPLQKLDLIAVPDFAAGAMENWGAITFRENALLYYEGTSSVATKQRVAEVVAHELVHQWFGNLVTMKWWDDLWLNESFATYMAYKAIDRFFPEWDIWSEYVSYAYFGGMALDSLRASHPIHVAVKKVEDIDELFDEIAYEKGGSVLRMLDEYLSEPVFMKGLQKYIARYAYMNAEAQDLWKSLESVSKTPVVSIIQKYLQQTGFPLLQVDVKNNKIELSQKRFLFIDGESKGTWDIPLVIKTEKPKETRLLFSGKTSKHDFSFNKYMYMNNDYGGFFITSYTEELLKNLGRFRKDLSSTNKVGLLHDLFALHLSLRYDKLALLNFIESYFLQEEDPECLSYCIGKLMGMYLLVPDDKAKELVVCFSKKALRNIGYTPEKDENPKVTALRNGSLSALSFFDDGEVSAFILKKFTGFISGNKTIEPDLRGIVYSGVVWHNEVYYETVKKMYMRSHVIEEQVKLLMAMGNVKSPKHIKKTLDFALSSEVRFANILYVIVSVSRNPYGKNVVFGWVKENWKELNSRTGGHANTLLRRILKTVIPVSCAHNETEALAFLDENPTSGLEQTYKQIKEELRVYARFMKHYVSGSAH